MKIGEFANICNTKISVLRHYDKQNLLKPEYIDRFTGYRYYSKEQISVFFRITALKKAGFSLSEIKEILARVHHDEEILALFDQKKSELHLMLSNLEEAKKIMLEGESMIQVHFCETPDGLQAKSSKVDGNEFLQAREAMEQALAAQDYQRISAYRTFGEQWSADVELVCDVVKLQAELMPLNEDTKLPFEDDASVIGKWKAVGEYAVREDFYAGRPLEKEEFFGGQRELYFLPGGQRYWCFGWTKGKLLIETGDSASVNEYTIGEYEGERYMFIELKSYDYRRGGKPVVLVLRQLDHKAYTALEIARADDIDKPLVHDESVIGKWTVYDFCADKDAFVPGQKSDTPWYFKQIEFLEGGSCVSLYGDEIISGDDMQVWTKGYVLRKWNRTACAYEIHEVEGVEYLIMEWKSGDYRWGGFETDYYVFVRA